MNFVKDNNSKDTRNEEELRALQESGAHIARARFDSIPDVSEFKGRLKAELLEKRELKRSSMWKKFLDALSHIVPTQKTFVFGMVVVLLLAVVSTMFINNPTGNQTGTTLAGLFIDRAYAKDNFEIIPTSSDGLAVDSTSEFIIKSKTALTRDALLAHLQINPETAFELTQISEHEFRVTPKNTLKEKQVYSIKIDAAYKDESNTTVERDFSFAFQVKNQFKLLSSIPGTELTGVPLNSGIEMTFSSENFSDYEKHFSIVPKVAGKFEVHGRTLVFVPKKLEPSTLYTVTLSKNMPVKGTAPMTEDAVIRFETAHERVSEGYQARWYINTDKAEFSPSGPMIMSLSGLQGGEEFVIKAYAFKSFDAYKTNFLKENAIPAWAYESRKNFVVPSTDITLAREFTLKAQDYKQEYRKYLVFPENLPKGNYWLEISGSGQTQHLFVEVTDLASYVSATVDKTLIWVNSLSTKSPLPDLQISLASGESLAQTNAQGLAIFDTTSLQIATSSPKKLWSDPMSPKVLQITQASESSLIVVGSNPYRDFAVQNAKPAIDDYILNFSSDRSLYASSDRVQFWGYIAKKDNSALPSTLTVGIPNTNTYFYGRSLGDLGFLQSVEVTPDAQGFFRGEIKLSNLTPSGYNLVLQSGTDQLLSRYIEVNQYVKPAYTLSVTADKTAVYPGETVHFKAQVNFFEGTPVPNYELFYIDQSTGMTLGTLKTDKNGQATWSIMAQSNSPSCDLLNDHNCQGTGANSGGQSISVSSANSEETPLTASAFYSVYNSKVDASEVTFTANAKNTAVVSSSWANIDISVLNDANFENDSKYFSGPAANQAVEGVVFETHYEKVESGQYYDFISKTTEKVYRYNMITTTTARFTGRTDAHGHFDYEVKTLPDRSYSVTLRMNAGEKGNPSRQAWLYSNVQMPSYNNMTWYSLSNSDEKNNPDKVNFGYKIGDQVKLQFSKQGSSLENTTGTFLFTQYQDGLKKSSVQKSSEYVFTFGEDHVPNVYIGVVYFDGTKYVETAEGDYRSSVRFDTRERYLNVEMTPNKDSYKPGEDVTLKIKVTDKNKKGHAVKMNISVIDEAFLALGGSNGNYADGKGGDNLLASLYRTVADGVLFTEKSHKAADLGQFGGAEGGGCFLAGTQIALSNGETKNIEDIQAGDLVATFKSESENTLVRGTVTKTQNHIVSEYLIINGTLRVTAEHRIFVNGEWKTAGDIRIGDMLRGQYGAPVKVHSLERRHELVKVYNFAVADYHTYIAGGIYVHNDKGGIPTRSKFPDVALYQFVDTDKNGNGSVTFKIPDSVTTWMVTAEAISTDLYAGIGQKEIVVTLPVFAVFSLPQDLLFGDKPSLSAAAYGTALRGKESVQFNMSGDLLSKSVLKTSIPFERNLFATDLAATKSGKMTLKLSSSAGDDAIEKSFTAVKSRLVEQSQILVPVKDGTLDLGAAKSATTPITLTFVDAGRGSLYNRMYPLVWNSGTRLDQKAGTLVSRLWFKDFFTAAELDAPADLTPYMGDIGFKLLPYSSADLILSAKASAVLKDTNAFDLGRMRTYFLGKLYDTNASGEELSAALWGAAALGEAVIPSIHSLSTKDGIQLHDKIYLGLAATELGDHAFAQTLFDEIMKTAQETDAYASIKLNDDKNQTLENTALTAILAARLQDSRADKLDKFVRDERKENVYNLEELLFVKEKFAALSKIEAKASLKIAGNAETLDLKYGESQTFTVVPNNFGNIQISNLSGSLVALVKYDRPATSNENSTTVKLERQYFVDGKQVTTLKEGDVVEIRLTPVFGKDAVPGSYLVEDSLPSGLKFTSAIDQFSPWVFSCALGFPFDVSGNRIQFIVDRDFQKPVKNPSEFASSRCTMNPSLVYKARVSTLGDFRQEGALIQSLESNDVKNFSTDSGMLHIAE